MANALAPAATRPARTPVSHPSTGREALSASAATEVAAALKTLSDPVRLRLLTLIAARAEEGSCVCDLAEQFEVSQPTISHHLKKLREAGVIGGERRGTWVYYRILPMAQECLLPLLHAMSSAIQGQATLY